MSDNLSKENRSKVMASIKGKNTKPEVAIRKLLWKQGIRYRIHNKNIFGIPDISIKDKMIAVFIDGCFWHGCGRCYKEPRTNSKFWRTKISDNKKRRKKVRKYLKNEGWNVLEFWEHEVNSNSEKIISRIISNINSSSQM